MNPLPAVMLRENEEERNTEREAPPRPASAPLSSTAIQRTGLTRTPAASGAWGFSPAKFSRNPAGVWRKANQQMATTHQLRYRGADRNRCSMGISGVEPVTS